MTAKEEAMQRVYCPDAQAWHNWLKANHAQKDPIWLVIHKKGSSKTSVTYSEAVDEALCWGWIDSKPNKLNDESYLQTFGPRKKGSVWSKVNKAKIERLVAEGRMQPAGLAKIDAAKADGTWTTIDDAEDMVIPADLAEALAAEPPARANFDAFAPSVRKPMLQWLIAAKRPETRAARIATIVSSAKEKINPLAYKPKK